MPSLVAELQAVSLAATHREGHKQDHQHDGYSNDDYDNSSRYGCNRNRWPAAPVGSRDQRIEVGAGFRFNRVNAPIPALRERQQCA